MSRHAVLLALLALLAVTAPFVPARADEALFGYLYTTDSLPAGHWEYEQIQTLREGKARGSYTSLDLRNELEYGVTDRFSASLYLNSSYIYTKNVYDPEDVSQNLPDQNDFGINGVSVELKYRLLSPYLDPVGFSIYAEPEIEIRDAQAGASEIERAIELRAILQKNFLDDTLIAAGNLMLEPEWELADGARARELWAELTFGVSYRFMPNWYVGLEFRNHREFPDMDLGQQEHSAFFVGPNVHYGSEKWWATLTFLPQIYGHPQDLGRGGDGVEIADSRLHLGQHEVFETRLKFGINF
jgi:hypothetical protein